MRKFSVLFFLFFVGSAFSQRDAIDKKNIAKVNEVNDKIVSLLSDDVSEKDIIDLGNFLYANKPKNDEIQFVSLLNPFLVKLNNDPKQKIDNVYLSESFRGLVGKTDVKVELESIGDFYEYLDPSVRTSDYMLNYKIKFKDDNSFGKNMDNYIEFNVFVSNCEVFSILHQIRYL
jgi:hypothetical protein